MLREQYKSEF